MMNIILIDNGHSRIVYQGKNPQGQTVYYCIQLDWYEDKPVIYRCSKDYEPSHVAKPVPWRRLRDIFEIPVGVSDLCMRIRHFILEK